MPEVLLTGIFTHLCDEAQKKTLAHPVPIMFFDYTSLLPYPNRKENESDWSIHVSKLLKHF
jgi:hypothetical protein